MSTRRRFLTGAGTAGVASFAGCIGLLEEDVDVDSEELEGDSTTEIEVEKHHSKLYNENEWVQGLEGGKNDGEIKIEHDLSHTRIIYGDNSKTIKNNRSWGLGYNSVRFEVGSYNGEDIYRTFERTGYEDGAITIETGLAFEDGGGDFGAYEEILES